MKLLRTTSILSLLTGMVAGMPVAAAQSGADGRLEEVIITAQKRAENVQDSPR